MLCEIQQILLSMSKEISKFVNKENIEIGMSSGTFLGAIRHENFIPWDDDVDFYISRRDADKLIERWDHESLKIISYKDADYYKPHTHIKIFNPNFIVQEYGDEEYGFPTISDYGLFIDIFIYDFYKNSSFDKFVNKYWGKILLAHRISRRKHRLKKNKIAIFIASLIPKFVIISINDFLLTRFEARENGTHVGFGFDCPFGNLFVRKCDFLPFKEYRFSDTILLGPENHDVYLSQRYGNYMSLPEVSQRKCHLKSVVRK